MNVVFGGVFNPPTLAHFKAAEEIKKRFEVERFVFLPVGLNYELKDVLDDVHRVNMLEILANKSDAEISLVEIESESFLGTYESLKSMDLGNPYFLLGSDNLHSLHKWKDAETLLSEFHFIVLNRQESIEDLFKNTKFLTKYERKLIIIDDCD